MKCFNDHLPEHQKFCGTHEITCEPKKVKDVDIAFTRKPYQGIEDARGKTRKSKPSKRATPESETTPDNVTISDVPMEQSEEVVKLEEFCEQPQLNESTELDESPDDLTISDIQERESQVELDEKNLDLDNDQSMSSLGNSFSKFMRGSSQKTFQQYETNAEEIKLRHAELVKQGYSWLKPEWVAKQLRSTPWGEMIKANGDLKDSVRLAILAQKVESLEGDCDSSFSSLNNSYSRFMRNSSQNFETNADEIKLRHAELIKQGYVWLTPEWVAKQLRSTPWGEMIKANGDLKESVRESIFVEKKKIGWERPAWVAAKLRKTKIGEKIRNEGENQSC
jgi:hypothetical protein